MTIEKARHYVEKSETASVESGHALVCAQIATAYAQIAIAEELKAIRNVMMDYVAETCGVLYVGDNENG